MVTNQVAGFYKWLLNKLKQGHILMANPTSPIMQSLLKLYKAETSTETEFI